MLHQNLQQQHGDDHCCQAFESMPFIREAWVQIPAIPTKALEQKTDTCFWGHISMVPQLAMLNSLCCKTWSYVGGANGRAWSK